MAYVVDGFVLNFVELFVVVFVSILVISSCKEPCNTPCNMCCNNSLVDCAYCYERMFMAYLTECENMIKDVLKVSKRVS